MNRVIRFADRRTAYSFVAELRRLYDLSRWADLWVYQTAHEVLVDIPIRDDGTDALTDQALRFGGWAPVGGDDLDSRGRRSERPRSRADWLINRDPPNGRLAPRSLPKRSRERARRLGAGHQAAHQPGPALVHAHAHQPAVAASARSAGRRGTRGRGPEE